MHDVWNSFQNNFESRERWKWNEIVSQQLLVLCDDTRGFILLIFLLLSTFENFPQYSFFNVICNSFPKILLGNNENLCKWRLEETAAEVLGADVYYSGEIANLRTGWKEYGGWARLRDSSRKWGGVAFGWA